MVKDQITGLTLILSCEREGIPTNTNLPQHRAVRHPGSMCSLEIKMCLRPDASGGHGHTTPPKTGPMWTPAGQHKAVIPATKALTGIT